MTNKGLEFVFRIVFFLHHLRFAYEKKMGWTTSLYFTCFFILCLCLCRLASLLSVDPNESQGCIIFCSIMSA